MPNSPHYIDMLERYLPDAVLTVIDSPRQFFRAAPDTFDALLYATESGSVWILIYPNFTVPAPRPDILKAPLTYAVRRGDERMVEFLSLWIELKKRDRTVQNLFDHWILGIGGAHSEPRWSVWKDVLGWSDAEKGR